MDIEKEIKTRPHVVILGAGASCAALPNGDANKKKISAMNDFIKNLNLTNIISSIVLQTKSTNLEDIYMELDSRSAEEPQCKKVQKKLEKAIYNYFSSFKLPNFATIYDFLVLSLTHKDLIATFNWDPLLVQALCRAQKYTNNIPNVAFLHGNVAVGYCEKDNIIGNIGTKCNCGKLLKPLKLLFPIKNKDYTHDIFIKKAWENFHNALNCAYLVTIFGYSAPKSDISAIEIMKHAWGLSKERKLEQIEIIDLKDEEEIENSWNEFIFSYHYSCFKNFFESSLARFPRRSVEATFDILMNDKWLNGDKGFKENMNFEQIQDIINSLMIEESNNNTFLSDPYIN